MLLAAAREVMADRGLGAPLDEIARRAGIGNATLYRRFPRRIDLIAAVYADRMAEHARAVEAAVEADDPWEGFRGYLEAAAELQVHDRGIADLITMDISSAAEIKALRDQAFRGLVRVMERAKAAGALRADSTAEDVLLILQANAGIVMRSHAAADQGSRRLVHLLLDGLRAEAASHGPTAPSARRMRVAMRERSRQARLLD